MGFYRSLAGLLEVQLTGADIASSLDVIANQAIPIFNIQYLDDVTVSFGILRRDYRKLQDITDRRGERLSVIKRAGLYWSVRAFFRRPVLLSGLALLLLAALLLPGRILFVSVEGNSRVPSQLIIEAAEKCGISFGAARRTVRSEKVKNMLLGELPELKWAGVNTYGCRAVITVREQTAEKIAQNSAAVCHITAAQDGIITSCTASSGTALCQPGQAVNAGDILISGYTDCGRSIIGTRAEGEIFADTNRLLTVVTPSTGQFRVPDSEKTIRYGLIIGKKRINFYKGSGISGGSCVKMIQKYVLTLPGGFTLPVALLKETITGAILQEEQTDDPSQLLQTFASDYLNHLMVAGTIIQKEEQIEVIDGLAVLTGSYICSESIGKIQEEKIGEHNGETNGTDRERRSGG